MGGRPPAPLGVGPRRAARVALLEEEKALTKARDALNARRRRLPMVEITEDYRFEGPDGTVGLAELFEGRRQLLVYHFMFDPEWDDGCPSCSSGAEERGQGLLDHLHGRDTTLAYVSRAPYSKIERYRRERGWPVPWYSSFGSTFNDDFHVSFGDETDVPWEYNYRSLAEFEAMGQAEVGEMTEIHGMSAFLRVDGRVLHTYSTYARGVEMTGGSYYYLDLTPLGRQEDWEEPEGRVEAAHAGTPTL